MENAGNLQEITVPPVEGVAGGGTSYGWGDSGFHASSSLKGTIDPSAVPSADLIHVWCMPNTTNVGPQETPRNLEQVKLLAAKNERESVQIAIRPKVSWGGQHIAGIVQVQCTDLSSVPGDRLLLGKSLTIRHVVPILGVPDALVPLDLPVSQITLLPGETTTLWVSFDIPSEQPTGVYEGEILITAVKANEESTGQYMAKSEKHQLYKELRSCLDIIEPIDEKPLKEVVM